LPGLRIGVMHNTINSKFGPKPLIQADYMTGLAAGADSFWVADHLNSVLPPSMWKPKYVGAARIIPKMDAHVEPWTMLGYPAGHNKVGRMTLGVAVTDTGRRNPAVTAQAAVTLQHLTRGRAHPRHRNRRARRQRTLWSGVVHAGRPIRRGDGHYPRAVGF
jgi:phthiodiolone/phenolphthiodiolone dimycocerosates ketoreductase